MEGFNELFSKIGNFFANNWISILGAVAVLIIGGLVIKLFGKLFMKIVYSTKIDNASGGFFVAIIRIILWIILIFGCASILGVNGNSFLVAFSSVALAIGLALKDSLSNIANGIIIVVVKPFKKGDYISAAGVEGTVKRISILTTELTTADNKRIVIPNNGITSSSIINYSANPTRRIDLVYSVSYSSDMKKVKQLLFESVSTYEYTLNMPTPIIYMEKHNASSVDFKVRFWVNNSDYWNAYFGFNERVFDIFKENNVEIPFNQLDVHIINAGETDEK